MLLFVLSLIVISTISDGANIVNDTGKQILGIFPHFGYSHFKVYYPLLRNLAERGHHLTVITYIPNSYITLKNYEELLLNGSNAINVVPLDKIPTPSRSWLTLFWEYLDLHDEGQLSCKRLYESGYVQQVLERHRQQPYDLVITEFFNSDCQLAIPYIMQTRIVALSSCLLMPWYYERILMPDIPSYIQSEFVGFKEPLNWFERLTNFLQAKLLSLAYRFHTNHQDNKLIERYLHIKVDVNAIAKEQTRIVFGNQHYSLVGIRPHTQKFIEVGGMHITEAAVNYKLPLNIEAFIDAATKPILLISWGSMIRAASIHQTKLQSILKALKRLQLQIIWKWESDNIPVINTKQFLFVKWIPQLALLCHPKIRLFWSHGGLLGTSEAVYCAKPLLVTPIYGDQFVNAYSVENRQIGRVLHFDDISEISLITSLQQLLQPHYQMNATVLSKVYRDRERSPVETATWWVEYILRHQLDADRLHSYAANLNVWIYYSIDSLALIVISLILIIRLIFYLISQLLLLKRKSINSKLKSKIT